MISLTTFEANKIKSILLINFCNALTSKNVNELFK